MELSDAVVLFSTETFFDVFTPETTFLGKVNPFAEVTNSGTSSQRRILETPIDQVIPTPRVVQATSSGEKYLVADVNPDYWNGEVLRHKYSTLPVDVMGAVDEIGPTINDSQSDKEVYAYPYFVRREIDDEERSDYLSGYEVYFSSVKKFYRGNVVKLASDYYRLKTDTWTDGAGYSVAQAVKIEDPAQTFDISTKDTVYNSETDSYAPTVVPAVACFVEPLRQDYEFVTPSFEDIAAGDKAISVLKAAVTINVGDTIGTYRVQSIRDQGDWVTCQCRNES